MAKEGFTPRPESLLAEYDVYVVDVERLIKLYFQSVENASKHPEGSKERKDWIEYSLKVGAELKRASTGYSKSIKLLLSGMDG